MMNELIRSNPDGTISFGDYNLPAKQKVDGFEHLGDIYKIKTYSGITKLEKNSMFLYESVPGTYVKEFRAGVEEITFKVTGNKDAQCTLGLESDTEYMVFLNNVNVGTMSTNLSGKLSVSLELSESEEIEVSVVRKE